MNTTNVLPYLFEKWLSKREAKKLGGAGREHPPTSYLLVMAGEGDQERVTKKRVTKKRVTKERVTKERVTKERVTKEKGDQGEERRVVEDGERATAGGVVNAEVVGSHPSARIECAVGVRTSGLDGREPHTKGVKSDVPGSGGSGHGVCRSRPKFGPLRRRRQPSRRRRSGRSSVDCHLPLLGSSDIR